MFTCTVTTPIVRWNAGPDITVTIFRITAKIGETFESGPDNAIIVTVVSTSPLVSNMTINGNLVAQNLVIECEATAGNGSSVQEEQLLYRAGCKLINMSYPCMQVVL